MAETFVALLRGINVSGRNKIPMAELRELCSSLGWESVSTYIQSGNVVFRSAAEAPDLERALENAIVARFGFRVPAIVRTAGRWTAYMSANPYPEAARMAPNLVLLALSKAPPHPGAAKALQARAAGGERVIRAGDAIWIHYASGVGRSKLTPALLDRLVGSSVTARNWRTVLAISGLLA